MEPMPLVPVSSYRPPFLLRNGLLQTVFPTLLRSSPPSFYQRERINTPDDDFLDLDWARTGSSRIAVLSHGLEGNSRRPYMTGMARMLNRRGWDALAWNYRSCSGEINRRLRMYHNGSIDDLDLVVNHVLWTGSYETVALVGFSLGGNLTLVYLGARARAIDRCVRRAVVFSAPCDLESSARELARPKNRIYMNQFLASLHGKIRAKMALHPGRIDDRDFHLIRDFQGFDDRYTAPIHGFRDAHDYWTQCSSRQFIPAIRIPTLIVNALDDPFLGRACFPFDEASASRHVWLETPDRGGHVGFMEFNSDGSYWSERRALEFLEQEDEPAESAGHQAYGNSRPARPE
jgi:predicted alpha/beta-fold hydrolase